MPIFDTLSQLDSYIINVTNKEIADHAGKLAVRVMNEVVEDTIYATPSSARGGSYENTFGMRNTSSHSVSKYGNGVINTGTLVEISISPNGEYPNVYGDVRDNNDMIVSWLNFRKNGGFYNGQAIKPQNYKMFDKAKMRLLKGGLLKNTIISHLKKGRYVISKRTLDGE